MPSSSFLMVTPDVGRAGKVRLDAVTLARVFERDGKYVLRIRVADGSWDDFEYNSVATAMVWLGKIE